MRILALDTTARRGSVALAIDGRVAAGAASDGTAPPAARLPADLMAILGEAGVALGAIDAFAVATGPGSFTGLRIGIATMQGLAVATERPLVGVSALDALAHLAAPEAGRRDIAAWVDAWRGEVYAARYGSDGTPAGEPAVGPPDVALAALAGRPALFTGNGLHAHADRVRASGVDARFTDPVEPALAPAIAALAAGVLRGGTRPAPHAIRPLYVRRPDAELARDARA